MIYVNIWLITINQNILLLISLRTILDNNKLYNENIVYKNLFRAKKESVEELKK